MKQFIVNEEKELEQVANAMLPTLADYPIVCFQGEMGAGKTTFIKVICDALGVQDAMSSPTFSIVNEYRDEADNPIYHFDFYRVEKLQEALDIGVEEYFYSGDLCLIEWPDMIKELIPENHLEISIKLVGDNSREITIRSND
ncbi:MAG: tRNA (adenosine(37)-N6)-threonylcarbamoyltransferase complex ATPase subunit type 1 TsaE [Rickettsiales bacterium]|nr:tRNA (adenosine(37)-N6)-threonylcarbamoyltransferase complex ATPase subunit type 1 TsaE [Rickettsiales bacterium]